MSEEFVLTTAQIDEISKIVERHTNEYIARMISSKNQNSINGIVQASSVYSLLNRDILNNATLQDELFEYIKSNCRFNLVRYYEKKLFDHSWNGDIFVAYTRFIKNGKYYPENEQILYNSIKSQSIGSNKVFWAMIALSSLVKDDDLSIKCFYLTIKDKKRGILPLLDLEKVKRGWNKRFKGIDVEKIAPQEYQYLSNLFATIEAGKTKDFFKVAEGHYVNIGIDVDLISQANKITKVKNEDAINCLFNAFLRYTQKSNEIKEVLSIDQFKLDSAGNSLIFYFSDLSKKDMIKSLACDLVDYATTKIDTNKLKGTLINQSQQDTDKFFSSFVMNYVLSNTLKNEDTPKTKKSKI